MTARFSHNGWKIFYNVKKKHFEADDRFEIFFA